jgi:DNA-binding GntR family transcriptional regulator
MLKIEKTPNLTELAYRSIKQGVLSGSFGESARLTEESLSVQLGISKSPVREALNRLEAEGLISIEPRRGAFTRQFSAKEVADLYELRSILEAYAVDAAVLTPALLEELRESVTRTKQFLKDGDKLSHIEEDLRFHGAIMAATGNEELCRVLTILQQKSLLCRTKSFELSASTTPVAHTRIYQALKNGDRNEAREAMREHISFVRERLLESFEAVAKTAV